QPRLQLVVTFDVWGDVKPRRRPQLRRAPQPVLRLPRAQPSSHEREHAITLTHSMRRSPARSVRRALERHGTDDDTIAGVCVRPEDLDVVGVELAGPIPK